MSFLDAIVGSGGTVQNIEGGTGVLVDNPSGPTVTVSLDPGQVATAAAVAAVQADVDAHEADTANPHAVTKAQVGLSNVTNDVQVKAAIASYSVKSPLALTDQIYTADSAAGNAIKRGTLADVVALASGGGSADNPWTRAPSSGITFQDEFTSDTSASYSFYNRTNSVAMSRVGNIDPYGGGALGNNQYNSTLYGSWLMIQFPAGKDVLMYKALNPANSLVTARMSNRGYLAGTADSPFVALFCAADAAGLPDTLNNSATIGVTTVSSGGLIYPRYQLVGGTQTNDVAPASAVNYVMDCVAERFAGTARTSWHYSSLNGATNNVPARTFTPTIAYVGFRFITAAGVAPTDQVMALDFLRIQSNANWIYSR